MTKICSQVVTYLPDLSVNLLIRAMIDESIICAEAIVRIFSPIVDRENPHNQQSFTSGLIHLLGWQIMASNETRRSAVFSSPRVRIWLLCVWMGLTVVELSGCSRSFWRKQADQDSYDAVNQKQIDGRWQLPRADITPDSRSRFYDPYDPDCSPLPPDDPAAAAYMKCSHGIPGYKSWHEFGQTMTVENPHWRAPFELHTAEYDPDTGEYKGNLPSIPLMKLPEAIELSYIHSRDYQTQLENLYLSALDLTFERFRFQVRYLGIGGGEPSSDITYTNIPGTQNTLSARNQFGVSQFLPSGGQWVVGLTNNTLWLFSGNNRTTSASVLSYSLVQPLLLGAGRKVAMESLTQAERNVLYQTRTLARFRKTLFTNTVSGGGGSVGYLDLLEQIQGIKNQEQSVELLEKRVESLRALAGKPAGQTVRPMNRVPPGLQLPDVLMGKLILDDRNNLLTWRGSMSEAEAEALLSLSKDSEFQQAANDLIQITRGEIITLDVAQLESTLRNSRNSLRNREVTLRDNLDRYKISLGLPPDLVVTIDEQLLGQFQFIDSQLTDIEHEIKDFIGETGKLDPDAEADIEMMKRVIAGLYAIQQDLELKCLPLIEQDISQVRENLLQNPANISESDAGQEYVYGENNFRNDLSKHENIKTEILNMGENLRRKASLLVHEKLKPEELKTIIQDLYSDREELNQLNFSLQVSQINFRVQLVKLNKFDLPLDMCVGLAVENRLDLMNQRAEVMDARRQVEVLANRLRGVVDLVVEGDIRTDPGSNNPVDFRGSSSSFRAGVALEAPLDQAAERNAYREALINYQRAKRDYMLAEDNVKAAIRSSWRQLQILEQNLETARQALRYSALEYDQAAQLSNAPTRPGQSSQGGVQGRNLISAIQNVLNAQNNLIGIWVDYERLRLNIYRDMDTMEIDPQGVWIDSFYQQLAKNSRLGNTLIPPPAPENFVIPLQMHPVPPSPSADLKAVTHQQTSKDDAVIAPAYDNDASDVTESEQQVNKGTVDEHHSSHHEHASSEQQDSATGTDAAITRRRLHRGVFSFRK